jgi:hypothetical protein
MITYSYTANQDAHGIILAALECYAKELHARTQDARNGRREDAAKVLYCAALNVETLRHRLQGMPSDADAAEQAARAIERAKS